MSNLSRILELNDHAMIYALQAEFHQVRGLLDLGDQIAAMGGYHSLESTFCELVKAVSDENYEELRLGVGNMITAILSLGYQLDMNISFREVKDIYFTESLYPCEDYRCYVDSIYTSVEPLKNAILAKKLSDVKQHIIHLLAKTYLGLPEFSRFSIHDDLVAITKATLSQICPTEDEAKMTVAKYAEEGCKSYYKETPNGGYAVYSSEDQPYHGEIISQDKFLPYYACEKTVLDLVPGEETRWNCYGWREFKALQILEAA